MPKATAVGHDDRLVDPASSERSGCSAKSIQVMLGGGASDPVPVRLALLVYDGHLELRSSPGEPDDPVAYWRPSLRSSRHVDALHLVVAMPTQNSSRPMLSNTDGRVTDGHLSVSAVVECVSEERTGPAGQLDLILRAAARVADFKPEVFERPQPEAAIDRGRKGIQEAGVHSR